MPPDPYATAPPVQVIANPAAGYIPPASSGQAAVRLAESLSAGNAQLGRVLGGMADRRRNAAQQQAKIDALKTHGSALADAVREGTLEKTQNPWYIQQYEQQAAQVRSQQQLTDVIADSQTWAERNDPTAYAQKLTETFGEIGQGYTGPDQQEGFNQIASQLSQQALATNTAYNVSRINEEHVQNISSLTTTAIIQTAAANGGKPTNEQVYAAMEPFHQEWLSTGGTESDWNTLTINSVVAAATNTGTASLINALDDPRGGKGALSNIAGPDGTPVASQLSTARYRIEQEAQAGAMRELRADAQAVQKEGTEALNLIQQKFGYAFLRGDVPASTIISELEAQGVSPRAAQYALAELSQSANSNQSLSRALMGANGERILAVHNDAVQKGYSVELYNQVYEMVRLDEMDYNEGEQILTAANATTRAQESEARSDARQNRSDARADATALRAASLQSSQILKDNRALSLGSVSTALQAAGINTLVSNPTARAAVERGAADAEGNWLNSHPGDVTGAQTASDTYLNNYLKAQIARRSAATGSANAANPNAGQ